MKELNVLTQKLIAEGYSKGNPPPSDKYREWQDYDGGWTYTSRALYDMTFKTPCGLFVKGGHFTCGYMSFGGIDWRPENNNPEICCPKFDGIPCELNHEMLRDHFMVGEKINHCYCSLTDEPYDYEKSYEKAHDDIEREKDRLFEEFSKKHNGRVCRARSNYNRHTKQWQMFYTPYECASSDSCSYCSVLGKELSRKKGNVYFDRKITWTEKGVGLLEDTHHTEITKGIKYLKKHVSITLCEVIAAQYKNIIEERYAYKAKISRLREQNDSIKYEILNIRAETRASRDIMQDLADVAEGITVTHSSDNIKAAKEQKSQRIKARKLATYKKWAKHITENPDCAYPDADDYCLWASRIRKISKAGYTLEQLYKKPKPETSEQLTLF